MTKITADGVNLPAEIQCQEDRFAAKTAAKTRIEAADQACFEQKPPADEDKLVNRIGWMPRVALPRLEAS